jgi:glycosyltransferase involved in cell wall biosynthesis
MIHELFAAEFSTRVDTTGAKRAAVQRADHVICISENTKQDLMRILKVPEQKITVIHLACDPVSADTSRPPDVTNNVKPFLLFVGARGGYKNFSRMLQAIAVSAALKSQFDVVAFGGGRFTSAEIAAFHAMGFAATQVRQISGDDQVLGRLYVQASAFIYPSTYEGFGIPPLEAMAHGCPVISSNASSMPEVIGDAGVYFYPQDVEQIRHAIESVVFDATRSAKLIAAGRQRVAQFSWTRCASETAAVYRALV